MCHLFPPNLLEISCACAHNSVQVRNRTGKFAIYSKVEKGKKKDHYNFTMSDNADMEGLSPEVLTTVLSALEASDTALLTCEQVSKKWRDAILSSSIYR